MNELPLEKVLRANDSSLPLDAVVEVPLLLESRLLPLLEVAANGQGMTAGTLVRRLIRDFLDASKGAPLARHEPGEPTSPEEAIA